MDKPTQGMSSARRTTQERRKVKINQQANQAWITQANKAVKKGAIIGNNYRILDKLGEGGMGVVVRVEHVVIGTQYALKLLIPEQINEISWLRFKSEAKTMAALNHSTMVKVYDLGLHNNQIPFYAMDLLTGITLEQAIIERGSLTLHDTIAIMLKVLDGLAYAHQNGITHRDLKPSNIILCDCEATDQNFADKAVKILDFGIAKGGNREGFESQSLTSVGEICGSPAYMSPEQCLSQRVDARSDIYSMGCTIFECLTGFIPFDADSPAEIAIMQQSAEPPTLEQATQGQDKTFSPSIEYVVAKCLAKAPADRYQSADELTSDLSKIRSGREISIYRKTARRPEESSRKRAIIWCLVIGLVSVSGILLLCSAIASLVLMQRQRTGAVPVKISQRKPSLAKVKPTSKAAVIEGQPKKIFEFPEECLGELTQNGQVYQAKDKLILPADAPIGLKLNQFKSALPFRHPELLKLIGNTDIAQLAIEISDIKRLNPQEEKAATQTLCTILDTVAGWQKLEQLTLGNINIEPWVAQKLIAMHHLKTLNLDECRMQAVNLAPLMMQIQGLTIENAKNDYTDSLLQQLSHSPALEHLEIDNSTVSPAGFSALTSCPKLKTLTLSPIDPGLSEANIASIKKIKSLRLVCLLGPRITPIQAAQLNELTQFCSVQSTSYSYTDWEVSKLHKQFPKIQFSNNRFMFGPNFR